MIDIESRPDRQGHVWGGDVKPLRDLISESEADGSDVSKEPTYDLLLLSDLVFNHSQVREVCPFCDVQLTV